MTYADFLLLFLVLMLIALVYMAPWDHIAAIWGLWTWARGQTWGLRLWAIPPEEYLFCIVEALLAITLTYALLTRKARNGEARTVLSGQRTVAANSGSSQDGRSSIPTRVSRGDHLEVQIEESNQEERS